jgi:hypothetical protein
MSHGACLLAVAACWHQTLFFNPVGVTARPGHILDAVIELTRPEMSARFLNIAIRSQVRSEPSTAQEHSWLMRTYARSGTKRLPLPVSKTRGTSRAATFGGVE